MLTAADKRTVSFLAATLYERAEAVDRAALRSIQETSDAGAVLRAWNQAFAPGDPDAFDRRLHWDGLDRQLAARLLAPDAAGTMPVASWIDRFDDVARSAIDLARALDQGAIVPDVDGVPFVEIWEAWRRASRRALETRLPSSTADGVSPDVHAAFDRQLIVELSRQGELALFDHFRAFLASTSGEGSDAYARFIGATLDGGLSNFARAYPVAARQLTGVASDWVDGTCELLVRLHADRADLAATFLDGADPGIATAVDLGLSDPHHGRRRVHAIEFASGLKLVYKPRSVALERVFGELLTWLNRDLDAPLPVLAVLDRGTHGWVELARHAPLPARAAVEQYYAQSGALMCLAWLLRARDLHMENVVATARGPAIVDLEMLLQPVSQSAARVTDAIGELHASTLADESSLSTGLLSLLEITPEGDAQDSGGLRGRRTGRLPFPRRVWKALGTAALHHVDEPTFSAAGRHEVLCGGRRQDPGEYAAHLLAGFERAYRVMLARRDELADASGPLHRVAGCSMRVLPRPTNQYAMLLFVLAGPKYQRDGAIRSSAIDVLHRAFSGATSRPDLWPVAVEERRALDRLDVPYFSVQCDGTAASCEGRLVVRGYFARSGLAAVLARLRGLSARDLDVQRALIARALGESVETRFATAFEENAAATTGVSGLADDTAPSGSAAGDDRSPFIDAAVWIARELLARAQRVDGGLRWPYRLHRESAWPEHHLYDGSLGPALLFSALSSVSSAPDWRVAALGALQPLREHLKSGGLTSIPDDENIGGLSGLGSIVYGLTLAGRWLRDDELLLLGRGAARAIAPRIAEDRCLDVVDGAAGAALALTALAGETGEAAVLDAAAECGRHLVERAVDCGGGALGWPSADGQVLVGFAHGAAGIVHALAELAGATGESRFADAAASGCRFIAEQFLPAHGNFALAGHPGGTPVGGHRIMTAWCHGAPGVALGLASALDICGKAAILSRFDAAVQTTARADVIQPDHLCCGAMGRAEVLLTIGQRLGRPWAEQTAVALAGRVAAGARRRGHFRLSGAGCEYRVLDPGFFRGISGIGYGMLRLGVRGRMPSVAVLESPAGAPQVRTLPTRVDMGT